MSIRVTQYEILCETDQGRLQSKANKYIANGWEVSDACFDGFYGMISGHMTTINRWYATARKYEGENTNA